jgi:N-acetylneuraminic acid mutarotase
LTKIAKGLTCSRPVKFVKANLSPVFSWSAAHKLASAWLIFALLAGNFSAILEQFAKEQTYRLTRESAALLGHNTNLADKLAFDNKSDVYRFNADAVDTANKNLASSSPSASTDPASGGVPDAVKAQLAMQQNVGASDKKDKQLYGVDLPVNPNKGITVADTNTKLSFTMTPNFPLNEARVVNNRVVYPVIGTDQQAVYSLKNNGLKEDIVLQSSPSSNGTLEYSYTLKLPDTLVAKLMPNGAVGIYSADPALFGQITASSPDDQKLIDNARKTAEKNYLVFAMPAPVIKQAGSDRPVSSATSQFTLNGDQLGVSVTGLNDLNYPVSVDPSVVVTSTADFQLGNNEDNNIDFTTAGQISRGALTGGTTGAWATGNPSTSVRSAAATVVYNGFMYLLGGNTGSVTTSVQLATIGSNGTLTWSGTSPGDLNTARAGHFAMAYNGYMYVVGGFNSGGAQINTVEYATINTTTGALTWNGSSPGNFTTARSDFGGVVYNNYMYIVGGIDSGGAKLGTVEYATIKADGTLTWTTTGSLTTARGYLASVAYNGYLYALGGFDASNNKLATVEYASISTSTGALTWLGSAGNFSPARGQFAAVVYNGYLYVIGGLNSSNAVTASVVYASINANGTLNWRGSANSLITPRRFLNAAVYNGILYTTGGQDAASTRYNIVEATPLAQSGGLGSFSTTASAPVARSNAASAVYNGFLYVTGGNGSVNTVSYATINSNGTLTWNGAANPFTTGRYGHTAEAYNGYLYVIGGYNAGELNSVEYATINSNGTLSWHGATNSFTTARHMHSSAIYNGFLYVLGGIVSFPTLTNSVQYATINSNGTLTWNGSAGSFTTARESHASVAYNGYLYVLGGDDPNTTLNSVEYAIINSNGTLSWQGTTNSFNTARARFTSVAYNGYLYVVGGYNGATDLRSIEYASVNANGTLSWLGTTSSLVNTSEYHNSVIYNGYIYAIGESGTTTCEYAQISTVGAGQTDDWSSLNGIATARYGAASVAYNGFLYILGGTNGTVQNTVEYASINATTGALAWITSPAAGNFTTPRDELAAVAYNGYMYVIGGNNGGSTTFATVEYATINSNGTLTWNGTTSPMATSRGFHSAVIYNNLLYVLGGRTNGSGALNSVEYASISATGALTWITSPAAGNFTTARLTHSSVAYGGYMYVMGGIDASGNGMQTVEYATINSNGTLTWNGNTTRIIGEISSKTTAVVSRGYVYLIGGQSNAGYRTNSVYYSQINSNGTLGNWIALPRLMLTGRSYHASVFYGGYIYSLGGLDTSGSVLGTVEYVPINNGGSGTTGSWATSGSGFSGVGPARNLHASVVYNGYIYITGGFHSTSDTACNPTASQYCSDVLFAQVGTNGIVGTWASTTGFSAAGPARYGHASVAYNGYIYVVGGFHSNSNTACNFLGSFECSDVLYAPLNTNGTVGTWATTTTFSPTGTLARYAHSSVVYNGNMYVIGGTHNTANTACNGTSTNACSDVLYAPINSDGTVGTWTSTVGFSNAGPARAYHGSVVANGYLYVLGGQDNVGNNLNTVLYAPVNTNGTVGTWAVTMSFNTSRQDPSPVLYNGYIYIMGGYNGTAFSDTQYASINPNGTLGTWTTTTSFSGVGSGARFGPAVAYNGNMYLVGGSNNTTNFSDVLAAPLNVQPRVARYSRLFDLGSSQNLTSLVYNGTLLGGGAVNVSWASAATSTFGAVTTANNVAPGSTLALSGSGRYAWVELTVDDSVAGTFADSVAGQSFITDITLNYAASYGNPATRLRGGKSFSNGVLQRLNP